MRTFISRFLTGHPKTKPRFCLYFYMRIYTCSALLREKTHYIKIVYGNQDMNKGEVLNNQAASQVGILERRHPIYIPCASDMRKTYLPNLSSTSTPTLDHGRLRPIRIFPSSLPQYTSPITIERHNLTVSLSHPFAGKPKVLVNAHIIYPDILVLH
jgi:hypothetical protein